MEAMHWTYEQFLAQPADLIDELLIRIEKRAIAERHHAKMAAAEAKRGGR